MFKGVRVKGVKRLLGVLDEGSQGVGEPKITKASELDKYEGKVPTCTQEGQGGVADSKPALGYYSSIFPVNRR